MSQSTPEQEFFNESVQKTGNGIRQSAGCFLEKLGGLPGVILLIIAVAAIVKLETTMSGMFIEVTAYTRAIVAAGALIGFGCVSRSKKK